MLEIRYHFAWNVVGRRPAFAEPVTTIDFISDTITNCSEAVGGFASLLWLAPDHIHLYADSDGEISPDKMAQELKRLSEAPLPKADLILDAGCGTGVFTKDFIFAGAKIVGLDLSFPMLARAGEKLSASRFLITQGDMERLPFPEHVFDKTVSVTAIEFIKDARDAVDELFRVTKPGGLIVVATLNSLSPWADAYQTTAGPAPVGLPNGTGCFHHQSGR